jgi:23S rRNA (cytosine1962-C5)-methyltransferase
MYTKNNLISKINLAIDYRKSFYNDKTTTAFRVFNRDGDGIPELSIDYFDGYYLIIWFNTNIYKFKETIVNILKTAPFYKGIYQKKRFNSNIKDPDDSPDFICGNKTVGPIIIKENNMNFAIYLDDGAMVGLFLDQRDVRETIKNRYSNGKTILNTFSYTGAFSVAAAIGGSKKTTSVDLAKRSLIKTKEQFKINNIDLNSQSIIVEDVFNYFKYAVKKKLLFDLVILDPPSFARGKKMTFSVAKDYVKLLKEAIQITSKDGVIVASTNYANLTMKQFKDFIDQAFVELNYKYKIKEVFGVPKDFKNSNYLKVIFIEK